MTREVPAKRSDFKAFRRFTTRWADNDAYGHVNNTVYYQWFDSAVNGWLIEQGLLDIRSGDPIALVVETRCSYFAPLEFPQDLEVGLRSPSSADRASAIGSEYSPTAPHKPPLRVNSST